MNNLYDVKAPKKSANLSINSDLLMKSKALNINLSSTLEQALKIKLSEAEGSRWREDNKKAIKVYNDLIEEQGCFSDEYREF